MKDKKEECTKLAEEILKNIEMSEIPFKSIILKGLRLCRLMNDETGIKIFTYESTGYPLNETGHLTSEAWDLCKLVGRIYYDKNDKDKYEQFAFTSTIAEMESTNIAQLERMKVASDPTSYGDNVTPYAISIAKNVAERNN